MVRKFMFKLIGRTANWAFNYSFAGSCFYMLYQEELPEEAKQLQRQKLQGK